MLDYNQEIANRIFKNAITNDKISHAYIIETNKYLKSDDYILNIIKEILSINCKIENSDELIDTNNHPDLTILSTDNLQFKKNELINLKNDFKTKPIVGKYKIYLIKEADKLSINLSNSLLKFIEEPEEGVIAFLMVENRYQIIKTILSRCQIVQLRKNIENQNINDFYNFHNYPNENIKEEIKNILSFIVSIERNKIGAILYENKFIFDLFKNKEEIKKMLDIMKLIYVDTLKLKNNLDIYYFNDYKNILQTISSVNENNKILKKINIITNITNKLSYNVNLNLLIDKLIIELGGV